MPGTNLSLNFSARHETLVNFGARYGFSGTDFTNLSINFGARHGFCHGMIILECEWLRYSLYCGFPQVIVC